MHFHRITPELPVESWCYRCDWRSFEWGVHTFDIPDV